MLYAKRAERLYGIHVAKRGVSKDEKIGRADLHIKYDM